MFLCNQALIKGSLVDSIPYVLSLHRWTVLKILIGIILYYCFATEISVDAKHPPLYVNEISRKPDFKSEIQYVCHFSKTVDLPKFIIYNKIRSDILNIARYGWSLLE